MKTELNNNKKLSTEQETPPIANVLLVAGRVKKRETYSQNLNVKYRCYKCDGKGCYKCK
jgi:hypothetical protein